MEKKTLLKEMDATRTVVLREDAAARTVVRFVANGPDEPFTRLVLAQPTPAPAPPSEGYEGHDRLGTSGPVTIAEAAREILDLTGLLPDAGRAALLEARREFAALRRSSARLKLAVLAVRCLAAAGGRSTPTALEDAVLERLSDDHVLDGDLAGYATDVVRDEDGFLEEWSPDRSFFRGVLETLREHGRIRHVRGRPTGEELVLLA